MEGAAHGATGDEGLVLYVEDDALNAALVGEIVSLVPTARLRVEATVAGALAAIGTETPVLVLVDLDLPDGSGLDVIDAVRHRHTAAPVPVLVITGDVSAATDRLVRDRGATGVLLKPYRVADLVAIVEQAVGA